MKKSLLFTSLFTLLIIQLSCTSSNENPFWGDGKEVFDVQEIFSDERFPNVVIAMDGTVLATWGSEIYRVRRSEDGGETWGPEITIANPGFQGGGTIVDENTGDILVFVEEGHPVAPLTVYRSKEFWPEHYTTAIYSDDGGKNWHTSHPFPAYGTGEAALEELSDGRIYYNSRRHLSTDGLNPRMRHIAWSNDGGESWQDLSVSDVLPDGDQMRDYGLMGGLVRLPLKNQDILLFSNIESEEGRTHGTVWGSFDGGITWPVKRLVDEGSFAYSSMVAGREGSASAGMIYLLYESGKGAKIARFNLPWLTGGVEIK